MLLGLIDIFQPDMVAFEDIQLQENKVDNVKTFKVLAEVFSIFHETLTEIDMEYCIVPSVTWKSGLNIKGRDRATQKRNASDWVAHTYGVKPTQDECDAICIGAYLTNKKTQLKDYDWAD